LTCIRDIKLKYIRVATLTLGLRDVIGQMTA